MWYEIVGKTSKDIDLAIDNKVNEIKEVCLNDARKFIKYFRGLLYENQAKWIRQENAIKGESFIDSLDPEMIIHDTYFKKVYKDNVEFKEHTFVKKYIGTDISKRDIHIQFLQTYEGVEGDSA